MVTLPKMSQCSRATRSLFRRRGFKRANAGFLKAEYYGALVLLDPSSFGFLMAATMAVGRIVLARLFGRLDRRVHGTGFLRILGSPVCRCRRHSDAIATWARG